MLSSEIRSFIIDTDTASDDAVALLLAVKEPSVEVTAVTLVAGNVPMPLVIRNAVVTLDIAGAAKVPVFVGHDKPLSRDLETAQNVHGEDGMGGASLPDPSRTPNPGHAVDQLIRLANDAPGTHTLVTLGPLTNIADALGRDPELLAKFAHTYMMLGS
ncbi:MAG: nucleoside hydrolase, partial [Acidimicrobiales bacterium]